MSDREQAVALLEQVPENKMTYVIAFLRGATIPDETPNEETEAAFEEVDKMRRNGAGQRFKGTAADFTAMLLAED